MFKKQLVILVSGTILLVIVGIVSLSWMTPKVQVHAEASLVCVSVQQALEMSRSTLLDDQATLDYIRKALPDDQAALQQALAQQSQDPASVTFYQIKVRNDKSVIQQYPNKIEKDQSRLIETEKEKVQHKCDQTPAN